MVHLAFLFIVSITYYLKFKNSPWEIATFELLIFLTFTSFLGTVVFLFESYSKNIQIKKFTLNFLPLVFINVLFIFTCHYFLNKKMYSFSPMITFRQKEAMLERWKPSRWEENNFIYNMKESSTEIFSTYYFICYIAKEEFYLKKFTLQLQDVNTNKILYSKNCKSFKTNKKE